MQTELAAEVQKCFRWLLDDTVMNEKIEFFKTKKITFLYLIYEYVSYGRGSKRHNSSWSHCPTRTIWCATSQPSVFVLHFSVTIRYITLSVQQLFDVFDA